MVGVLGNNFSVGGANLFDLAAGIATGQNNGNYSGAKPSAGMNAGLRHAGATERGIDLPPDAMAALLRVLGEKLKPATNNPTLGAVQHIRPDLFARHPVGGL